MKRSLVICMLAALLGICSATAQERTIVLKAAGCDSTARIYALPEALVYSGKKKSKKLAGNGMRVAGARTAWTPDNLGHEIGSVVETDNMFQVQKISFNVMSNGIEGLKLSVNIYALNEEKMQYSNIMHTPMHVDIPIRSAKQKLTAYPTEQLFLVPGRYFVSVKLMDCSTKAKASWNNSGNWDNEERYRMSKQALFFPLYMKESFMRKGITDELERVPVNIGLQIKGVEYKD